MDALNPLVKLFQNRTFVTFLLSAIVSVAVGLIPTLAPYQEQIISVGVALVLLSAGGEVIQGVAKTNADAKVQIAQAQVQSAQLALETARTQAAQGVTIGSQWTATPPTWSSGTLTTTAPVK